MLLSEYNNLSGSTKGFNIGTLPDQGVPDQWALPQAQCTPSEEQPVRLVSLTYVHCCLRANFNCLQRFMQRSTAADMLPLSHSLIPPVACILLLCGKRRKWKDIRKLDRCTATHRTRNLTTFAEVKFWKESTYAGSHRFASCNFIQHNTRSSPARPFRLNAAKRSQISQIYSL